jgi:hypothetical protein
LNFPASIEVKNLDQQHPEYAALVEAWSDIELLYKDGAALRAQASRFLKKKPRELADVYAARLRRFTSLPILGTALGWYQSAMFANDPQVSILRDETTVQDDPFYTAFLTDCDGAEKKFVDFARDVFQSMLLFRSSYVLVDRDPVDATAYPSLKAQQDAGALDVHLVRYDPSQVINWETDDQGNLEWVLIATTHCEREFPGITRVIDRWYYFDREQCAVYEAERKDSNQKADNATLVQGYPRQHALSAVGRVPVRWIALPDGLWLGNRSLLPACSHLDLVNALDWGIFNGCLPTMYVKGEYRDSVEKSEVGFVHLEENGDIGYVEPAGTTYELAMRQIDTWREELYRQVYLQALARSTKATAAAQSGFSKEMDMAPGKDVLNGLGDCLRTGLTNVLMDVADARNEDNLTFTVKGLEFTDNDQDIINRYELFLGQRLGETTEKEVKKMMVRLALKDADEELLQKAESEIDAMPTDDEAAQQQLQERISASFGSPPPVGLKAGSKG